jgi:hypothetical protein
MLVKHTVQPILGALWTHQSSRASQIPVPGIVSEPCLPTLSLTGVFRTDERQIRLLTFDVDVHERSMLQGPRQLLGTPEPWGPAVPTDTFADAMFPPR